MRVARTIHYAHLRGVLHCDLKPSNILLDSQGEPPHLGFRPGQVRLGRSGMTQTGLILGTPSYMALSKFRSGSEVTTLADIYSLGASSTNCSPAGRHSRPRPLRDPRPVRSATRTPSRSYNPWVDGELEAICLRCLERNRAGDTSPPRLWLASWSGGSEQGGPAGTHPPPGPIREDTIRAIPRCQVE